MSFLEGAGLVLGIGVAVGMLAGTTGTRGSARGRMTILAAALGLLAGILLAGAADLGTIVAALIALAGAAIACVVISDVVSGAGRREGSGTGALGFLVSLAALIVVAAALLLPVLTLIALAGLLWLGASRHRRAQRKHAGLRVLR
ncbi:MAG TPA: hypothetical protein VFC52_03505 [Solirubrobacterales bacterium]|nr:hypothetical protein [Solirubrobacterales bacterium]